MLFLLWYISHLVILIYCRMFSLVYINMLEFIIKNIYLYLSFVTEITFGFHLFIVK